MAGRFKRIMAAIIVAMSFVLSLFLTACNGEGGEASSSQSQSSSPSSSADISTSYPPEVDRGEQSIALVVQNTLNYTVSDVVGFIDGTKNPLLDLEGYMLADLYNFAIDKVESSAVLANVNLDYYRLVLRNDGYWYSGNGKKAHTIVNKVLSYKLDASEPLKFSQEEILRYGNSTLADLVGINGDLIVSTIVNGNKLIKTVFSTTIYNWNELLSGDRQRAYVAFKASFGALTLGEAAASVKLNVGAGFSAFKIEDILAALENIKESGLTNYLKDNITFLKENLADIVVHTDGTFVYTLGDAYSHLGTILKGLKSNIAILNTDGEKAYFVASFASIATELKAYFTEIYAVLSPQQLAVPLAPSITIEMFIDSLDSPAELTNIAAAIYDNLVSTEILGNAFSQIYSKLLVKLTSVYGEVADMVIYGEATVGDILGGLFSSATIEQTLSEIAAEIDKATNDVNYSLTLKEKLSELKAALAAASLKSVGTEAVKLGEGSYTVGEIIEVWALYSKNPNADFSEGNQKEIADYIKVSKIGDVLASNGITVPAPTPMTQAAVNAVLDIPLNSIATNDFAGIKALLLEKLGQIKIGDFFKKA